MEESRSVQCLLWAAVGKIAGYTQKVAEYLGIQKERVAVRGPEVLTTVEFMVDNFKRIRCM